MRREHPAYEYIRKRRALRERQGEEPDTLDLMARQRELQLQAQRRMAAWLQEEGAIVDRAHYLKMFDRVSREMQTEALGIAIEGLAMVDGVVRANNTLQVGLKMENAALDVSGIVMMHQKVLKLRLLALVAKRTRLPATVIQTVLERAAAREFPVRDGVPATSGRPAQPLESELLAEARRLIGGRSAKPAGENGAAGNAAAARRPNPGFLFRPGSSGGASSPFGLT